MKKKKKLEGGERFGMKFTLDKSLDNRPPSKLIQEKVKQANEVFRNMTSWPPELDKYFKKK